MSVTESSQTKFAPIRSLDDYLFGSARFGLPDYQNKEKWNYRIVNNLLYYQSNYMISALVIFIIVGYIKPYEMLLGGFLVGGTFAVMIYASSNRGNVQEFKKKYPAVVIAVVMCISTLLMYALGSILVFVFGIALPLFCILLHASLRMRNLKNKVNNKVESVGLKKTPMGILMKAMDQDF